MSKNVEILVIQAIISKLQIRSKFDVHIQENCINSKFTSNVFICTFFRCPRRNGQLHNNRIAELVKKSKPDNNE